WETSLLAAVGGSSRWVTQFARPLAGLVGSRPFSCSDRQRTQSLQWCTWMAIRDRQRRASHIGVGPRGGCSRRDRLARFGTGLNAVEGRAMELPGRETMVAR